MRIHGALLICVGGASTLDCSAGFVSSTLTKRPLFPRIFGTAESRLCTAGPGASQKFRSCFDAPKSQPFLRAFPENADGLLERGDDEVDPPTFDGMTTASLVMAQAALIVIAGAAASAIGIPNFGLGSGVSFSTSALLHGSLTALPLVVVAYLLDLVEDKFPALWDVTRATQRSVLALLGGKFKPLLGIATAAALGVAAGLGEEMLFRGVMQFELGHHFGEVLAVATTSIIFGALHAVTPLYAFLASLASVYFGWLYLDSGNLAVPITAHTVYDIGALLYAHWEVSQLTIAEQLALAAWKGPMDRKWSTTP